MIGLEDNKVQVIPYQYLWKEIFQQEKLKLASILNQNNYIDIQHVGSTSIPNMSAKPIIDIAIAVDDYESAKVNIKPICEAAGYLYKGENGIPRRHYFVKVKEGVSYFHIHMNEINSKDWIDQIYFRDYLTANPQFAQKYLTLKLKLAETYPNDRNAYLEGKGEFIKTILETKFTK